MPEPFTVAFLAAGEYNENYLVEADGQASVFRINHGTQLGLDNQIGYEFGALGAVASSGVTPRPLALVERDELFDRGAMLMEYLPGRPLDYTGDLDSAAECLARIHRVPYDVERGSLLVQANPINEIVAESRSLLARYPEHPLRDAARTIRAYRCHVERLATTTTFGDDEITITNTEVNAGNFLVHHGRVRLVDWEKAVASYRYQDLGHFLVPTTTLWKTDYRFDAAARRRFLTAYHDAAEPPVSLDQLDELTTVLEATILLRAFSWVYMAYYEYTTAGRALRNEETFHTMKRYLDEIDAFLELP